MADLSDGSTLQSSVKNVFIRGSVVRYVHLPGASVDTALLEDATRRGKLVSCPERYDTNALFRYRSSSASFKSSLIM